MKKRSAFMLAVLMLISCAVCAFTFTSAAENDETAYHIWDFEDGINGWGDSISSSVKLDYFKKEAETQALAFDFAYNPSEVGNWDNCPIISSPTYLGTINGATAISFEVYLEKGKSTKGSIEIYPVIQSPQHNYWFMMGPAEISTVNGGEETDNGLIKYTLSFDLIDSSGDTLSASDVIHVLTFTNCGKFTDYNGTIYYDNIKLVSYPEKPQKPEELTVTTSIKGAAAAQAGDTLTVRCDAVGGTGPYRYTFYALKDGKIEYKSEIWTAESSAEITLNEAGKYRIMTYCRDSKGKKVSAADNITVYSEVIKPSSIALSERAISIEKGKTASITANILPSDAMDKTVEWSSDKKAVARVDENGVITAVAAGSAIITAKTSNGLTAQVEVTVTPSTATKYIALTFDDGPDANTGTVLDTLKEKNAKATFFVLYSNAQYNGALIKRAANEGNEIGNHTKTHGYLTQITQIQALEEIYFVNDFVNQQTGVIPTLYRPPYLAYNSNVLAWFPNMTAIGCSIDTADWSGISASEITAKVLNNAKNGDIVLMHVTMSETRKALPDIIDGLYEMGFECVTVSELFDLNNVNRLTGRYYNSIYY